MFKRTISECMKTNVISISSSATIREAVELVIKNRIGTLVVVDETNKLKGIVRLRDLLSIAMPDFVSLVKDFGFLHDFGAVKTRQPDADQLNCCITKIIKDPIYVHNTSSLLQGAAVLQQHGISDVVVTDKDGVLLGIASHVDIGTAMMQDWIDKSNNNE